LRRSGASHVLGGGDRSDIAIMGRDAAELDYDLVIAGGENLRAAPDDVPLAEGTLMVGLHEPSEIAAPRAIEAFARRELVAEGYMLPAYAALEVAAQALIEAEATGRDIAEVLSASRFETALGTIYINEKGDLSENPYRLFRYDGENFVEAD
jgi:branched-chain amino acid transport system substrate-binding protein